MSAPQSYGVQGTLQTAGMLTMTFILTESRVLPVSLSYLTSLACPVCLQPGIAGFHIKQQLGAQASKKKLPIVEVAIEIPLGGCQLEATPLSGS